jgi:hypothetical protein
MSTESQGGMILTGENRLISTLSNTNPRWTVPEANPGPRGENEHVLILIFSVDSSFALRFAVIERELNRSFAKPCESAS